MKDHIEYALGQITRNMWVGFEDSCIEAEDIHMNSAEVEEAIDFGDESEKPTLLVLTAAAWYISLDKNDIETGRTDLPTYTTYFRCYIAVLHRYTMLPISFAIRRITYITLSFSFSLFKKENMYSFCTTVTVSPTLSPIICLAK